MALGLSFSDSSSLKGPAPLQGPPLSRDAYLRVSLFRQQRDAAGFPALAMVTGSQHATEGSSHKGAAEIPPRARQIGW